MNFSNSNNNSAAGPIKEKEDFPVPFSQNKQGHSSSGAIGINHIEKYQSVCNHSNDTINEDFVST